MIKNCIDVFNICQIKKECQERKELSHYYLVRNNNDYTCDHELILRIVRVSAYFEIHF